MILRRREFITLLGGAAAVWPLAARAQVQPVIGYLCAGSHANDNPAPLLKGLSETGYIEGKNFTIEYRWAENKIERLPELAADLVRRRVAVIVTNGGPAAAFAAKTATATIPIVFIVGSDPVERGLVPSLNRPGGNVTGVVFMNTQATAKRLGLLHDMVPGGTRFGMLVNSSTVYEPDIAGAIAGAATFTGQIEVLTADTVREIDTAFASLVQKRVDALMVNSSVLFLDRRVQIVSLALRHAVPAIYFGREFADVGGLMSYGSNIADQVRQGGVYVGRVLKGDKPADLPVMLPTKFEFVVNLQAAKTLGLTVPPTLLAIADEVIE